MGRPWHGVPTYLAPIDRLECSVHVQRTSVFCTFCSFGSPAGKTICTNGPKLAGHTYTALICTLFWLPFSWDACYTHQNRRTLFREGSRIFRTSDTKFGTYIDGVQCAKFDGALHLVMSCNIAHTYIDILTSENFGGTRNLVH